MQWQASGGVAVLPGSFYSQFFGSPSVKPGTSCCALVKILTQFRFTRGCTFLLVAILSLP